MTSTSLHPTPSPRSVVIEQFRAVGLALRNEGFFFIGALLLIGILVVANTIRMVNLHPSTVGNTGFTYGSAGAVPIFVMALLIPFGVWRAEDPAHRAYHWTMPVARGPHTIVKFLSGWAWLMIAAAVYLVFVVLLATVISMITGAPNRVATGPGWEWLVAFTATTLAYLLTSIAVIGSDHAWRWVGGLFLGFWVLIGIFESFGMRDVSTALRTVWDGGYGLKAALFGIVPGGDDHMRGRLMNELSMIRWLVAMPLWIIGSGVAVTLASYRHRE
jgi:hypothetical protein